MKKVAIFMGTRPEAIKLAPVIRALRAREDVEVRVVSTGQHREMLQQVIDVFEIGVDDELDVMRPNQSLAALTARLLTGIDELLMREAPDMTVAQGDTTTVLAGALASFYRQIPFAHVEAGLRTGNLMAPFPEEANRVLAGRVTTLHFPPTDFGRQNLLAEGVADAVICVTGNTVIDALQMEVDRQQSTPAGGAVEEALARELGGGWRQRRMVLITGHRRESFGQGFMEICSAIVGLARAFPKVLFVYPVHLNPNVQRPVHALLGGIENVRLIAPQPYSTFVGLLNACYLVITDSGGVQEEAPGLGKPVLVMRDTTERPEGVEAGTVALVGANEQRIVAGATALLSDSVRYAQMAQARNPYGDGRAGGRIAERICAYLSRH